MTLGAGRRSGHEVFTSSSWGLSRAIGRSGWNSLRVGGAIPDDELLEAIDASYDAVVAKLPKRDRPRSG